MRGLSHPTSERRAVDIDALCRHHLGLTVERQVVIELGNDDVGERAERSLALCNRLHRSGRLNDAFAGAAAILGTDIAHDAPADRHDVEHLVGIGAEPAQRAAT